MGIVLGGAGAAEADSCGCGMPSRSFTVKTVGVNSWWTAQFDTARANWHTSGAGAKIRRTTDSPNKFTAGRYENEDWLALYTKKYSGPWRQFTIKANSYQLARKSGTHMREWSRSTATHELGHALNLDDNPGTRKASLMKHGRDRVRIQKPQPYDVAEVKRMYG
ncbi:hypothetical protein [Streptomyces sp. SAJ15]|uniref:hypothetical protein n=1 Tax=Streptomyces sp. SAJ15 TaxID=2011095 RepID=UPI00118637E5|nr:hypothetical protein [Streptomyces sp. SAJ15]TVL94496.1 hypothetical protein CD790_02550 [Streptomyces sp. SAJ15]